MLRVIFNISTFIMLKKIEGKSFRRIKNMKDYERMAIKSKISSNQERKSTRIKLNIIDLNQIRNILHPHGDYG